jgi:hypothetical protein
VILQLILQLKLTCHLLLKLVIFFYYSNYFSLADSLTSYLNAAIADTATLYAKNGTVGTTSYKHGFWGSGKTNYGLIYYNVKSTATTNCTHTFLLLAG